MEEEKEFAGGVQEGGVNMDYNEQVVRKGLGQLGRHPQLLSHVYLGLKVPRSELSSIDILPKYPNLMYVDVSENNISDLRVLAKLPTLVQLNASKNSLTECLDFAPLRCTEDNAWSSGDEAIGSMLTLVNLSYNSISQLHPAHLGSHLFLEALLLSHNSITRIQGLESLRYLQVLDLSYNNITAIEGLGGGLRIQELNLEGNLLTSASGLENLPHLSILNISRNKIRSLSALAACASLHTLNAGFNDLSQIRQTQFLQSLEWLSLLILAGNACCKKTNYRYRVLYQLRNLQRLDVSIVTAEEVIRTCNLYRIAGGDLAQREALFSQFFPGEMFEDFGPQSIWDDDEADVDLEVDVALPEVAVAVDAVVVDAAATVVSEAIQAYVSHTLSKPSTPSSS